MVQAVFEGYGMISKESESPRPIKYEIAYRLPEEWITESLLRRRVLSLSNSFSLAIPFKQP
jgi:hypothetical protein